MKENIFEINLEENEDPTVVRTRDPAIVGWLPITAIACYTT